MQVEIWMAFAPLLVIALQAWLWRRDLRKRSTDAWRRDRLAAFLDVELPNPCRRYGHELGDHGCRYCNDLTPMWAYQGFAPGRYRLDPEGYNVSISETDRRFAGFQNLGWRYSFTNEGPTGIAWVNRGVPGKVRAAALPATSIAEQRKPEYTPLHGNQAPQVPPQGGPHRTERGAPGREAQERFRAAFRAPYT